MCVRTIVDLGYGIRSSKLHISLRLDTAVQSRWEHSAELQIAFLAGIPYACSVCAFDVRFPPCLPFDSFAQTCERLPYWRVQLTSIVYRERGCQGTLRKKNSGATRSVFQ